MNSEPGLAKRLERAEFAAALQKGQGRALLHVLTYGLDDVFDLVLEACLHNQVYDQQLESERGTWLFQMLRDSPHYSKFRNAILNVIQIETDFWSLFQLCRLIQHIAALGDEEAHQALQHFVYRNAADPTSEGDWLGVEELLSIEGTEGVIGLARIFGQRLVSDPNDFVDDSILHNEAYPEYAEVLIEYSLKEKPIRAYQEYLEKRKGMFSSTKPLDKEKAKRQNHSRIRRELSLQRILDDARKGIGRYPGQYGTFGLHATLEELDKVYTILISDLDVSAQIRLLGVFRRAKLPRVDDILLSWARSENEELRAATIASLSQVSDPRIHQLARTKAETGQLLGADNDALGLFIHNYESDDGALIKASLDRLQPDREDAHSLGYSILLLADEQDGQILPDLLLWVYENTPCAHCRSRSVAWLDRIRRLSDALRFECGYDSDEDIRAFAHRKSDG